VATAVTAAAGEYEVAGDVLAARIAGRQVVEVERAPRALGGGPAIDALRVRRAPRYVSRSCRGACSAIRGPVARPIPFGSTCVDNTSCTARVKRARIIGRTSCAALDGRIISYYVRVMMKTKESRINLLVTPDTAARIEAAVAARNEAGAHAGLLGQVTRSTLVRAWIEAGLAAEPKRRGK